MTESSSSAAILRAAREYAVGALMVANVYQEKGDEAAQDHHKARAAGAIYVIALLENRQPSEVLSEVCALVDWSTG